MRLSDLPPDVRLRVLQQADAESRPRAKNRKVATGAPYRAMCATCGEIVESEAASRRHTLEHGHHRWESIYPERLCVCPPSVRVLHGDDPSTCYRCSARVSESFDLIRGSRGYAPTEWLG